MSRQTNRPIAVTETAVPTLRVMRLQKPEIHQAATMQGGSCALHTSLCLPDSLTVYVGEHFTAYLGVLNASQTIPIRKLTVNAQLQTPSQRFQLPSNRFDFSTSGGLDIPPGGVIDAIVSRGIEEAGQHILRVEVGYLTAEGGSKTFRKFYRFQVQSPLKISARAVRIGDDRSFVCVEVESITEITNLVVASVSLDVTPGMAATRIDSVSHGKEDVNASALLDSVVSLIPGACHRYLFDVSASSKESQVRGIAAGDYMGRAVIVWRKAMGETGTIYSESIHCPVAEPVFDTPGPNQRMTCSKFEVHKSGWTVDVAAVAASNAPLALPVTVEPVDPATSMLLHKVQAVQFLVVNHSSHTMNLQLQFLSTPELAVSGSAFVNLGDVHGNGGSIVSTVKFLPLAAGLIKVEGCAVIDLASGREMIQPPLFSVFVTKDDSKQVSNAQQEALPVS